MDIDHKIVSHVASAVAEAYEHLDLEEIDNTGSILYLLCGQDIDNKNFYAYMAIKPSLYQEFMLKQAKGIPFLLADYGPILNSGLGTLPPAEIQAEMKNDYGFSSDYQKQLETEFTL